MSSRAAAEFFSKGKEALSNGHIYLARVCFENAINEEHNPAYCSYYGVALAKSRGEYEKAIELAKESIAAEPCNSDHYLNLGRIYLAAGKKKDALGILRTGINLDRNKEIMKELEAFGTRGRPVLIWLPRDHPVNKYLGILLARLGLRRSGR